MDKNRHLISKYLEKELDPLTNTRFEEELRNDPLLQSELKFYMEVDKALSETETLNLRTQLRDMYEKITPELKKGSEKSTRQLMRLAVAATLIAILTFGSFNLSRFWSGNQHLVNRFYSPYEMTMVNRSSNSEMNVMMHQALTYYENQEYKEAVKIFEQVLEADPTQMATRLYSGISFFEIKEYQKASNSFNIIIEHKDNLYIEQAEWYLGFCFLMRDEKSKAIRQFEKISNSGGYYSEKARQIIKKLV